MIFDVRTKADLCIHKLQFPLC